MRLLGRKRSVDLVLLTDSRPKAEIPPELQRTGLQINCRAYEALGVLLRHDMSLAAQPFHR
jgi:hypothetical protein